MSDISVRGAVGLSFCASRIYGVHSWIVGRGDAFSDMPAGEAASVCAAPMGTLPVGGQQPSGDMLAAWTEGLGQSRAEVHHRMLDNADLLNAREDVTAVPWDQVKAGSSCSPGVFGRMGAGRR
jgi:hypothetical protein